MPGPGFAARRPAGTRGGTGPGPLDVGRRGRHRAEGHRGRAQGAREHFRSGIRSDRGASSHRTRRPDALHSESFVHLAGRTGKPEHRVARDQLDGRIVDRLDLSGRRAHDRAQSRHAGAGRAHLLRRAANRGAARAAGDAVRRQFHGRDHPLHLESRGFVGRGRQRLQRRVGHPSRRGQLHRTRGAGRPAHRKSARHARRHIDHSRERLHRPLFTRHGPAAATRGQRRRRDGGPSGARLAAGARSEHQTGGFLSVQSQRRPERGGPGIARPVVAGEARAGRRQGDHRGTQPDHRG